MKKKMGRPPSGKPRAWLRLHPVMWQQIDALARKNHRTRDLQIEAMLEVVLQAEGLYSSPVPPGGGAWSELAITDEPKVSAAPKPRTQSAPKRPSAR